MLPAKRFSRVPGRGAIGSSTSRPRLRASAGLELFFSYVRSRTASNLSDFAGYVGSFPNAIIHPNQVATQPTDLPSRFVAWLH